MSMTFMSYEIITFQNLLQNSFHNVLGEKKKKIKNQGLHSDGDIV